MKRRDAKQKGYQGYRLSTDESSAKELKKRRERAEKNAQGKQSNAVFSVSDTEFVAACQKADVKPTTRQASKFRNGYGRAAFAAGRNHRKVNGLVLA